MADNEEGMEGPPRGNEWEVVSLTASAYAASPGPKQAELNDNDGDGDGDVDDKDQSIGEEKGEASETMFMSHHFVFPPNQHENLPVEVEKTEIHSQLEDADVVFSDFVAEEGGKSNTRDGENWDAKALNMSEDFSGIQFVDDKGKTLSVSGTEFEDNMTFEGLNVVDKEQNIYTTDYSSAHGEATMGGSIAIEENQTTGAPIHLFEEGPDSDISPLLKSIDDSKDDDSQFPSEAWWKRRAAALYAHAKETNAVWSIFIAAAVMGLVILGQRWQQERWQVLQHKSQFGINEKVGRMLGPLSRLKDAIVSGHRRGSIIRGSTTSEH